MLLLSRTARSLAFALVLVVSAGPLTAVAEEPVARIAALSGAVNVLRDGQAQTAGTGTALAVGDQVLTGAASRARIAFSDGSMVTIGESTVLAISNFVRADSGGPAQAALDLITGIVRLVAAPPRDAFEVRTRAAVASVRGTRWIVASEPERDSVFVIEGSVEVRARRAAGSVTLSRGEGTDIVPGEPPSAPKAWGAARVEDVMSRTRAP